ncbi:MAG: hypothetical protein M1826_003153 [Phylliscum demangeonii]|nr:MAG: hypothetical protein M1826_003153 [Phylliscum demangeonii]
MSDRQHAEDSSSPDPLTSSPPKPFSARMRTPILGSRLPLYNMDPNFSTQFEEVLLVSPSEGRGLGRGARGLGTGPSTPWQVRVTVQAETEAEIGDGGGGGDGDGDDDDAGDGDENENENEDDVDVGEDFHGRPLSSIKARRLQNVTTSTVVVEETHTTVPLRDDTSRTPLAKRRRQSRLSRNSLATSRKKTTVSGLATTGTTTGDGTAQVEGEELGTHDGGSASAGTTPHSRRRRAPKGDESPSLPPMVSPRVVTSDQARPIVTPRKSAKSTRSRTHASLPTTRVLRSQSKKLGEASSPALGLSTGPEQSSPIRGHGGEKPNEIDFSIPLGSDAAIESEGFSMVSITSLPSMHERLHAQLYPREEEKENENEDKDDGSRLALNPKQTYAEGDQNRDDIADNAGHEHGLPAGSSDTVQNGLPPTTAADFREAVCLAAEPFHSPSTPEVNAPSGLLDPPASLGSPPQPTQDAQLSPPRSDKLLQPSFTAGTLEESEPGAKSRTGHGPRPTGNEALRHSSSQVVDGSWILDTSGEISTASIPDDGDASPTYPSLPMVNESRILAASGEISTASIRDEGDASPTYPSLPMVSESRILAANGEISTASIRNEGDVSPAYPGLSVVAGPEATPTKGDHLSTKRSQLDACGTRTATPFVRADAVRKRKVETQHDGLAPRTMSPGRKRVRGQERPQGGDQSKTREEKGCGKLALDVVPHAVEGHDAGREESLLSPSPTTMVLASIEHTQTDESTEFSLVTTNSQQKVMDVHLSAEVLELLEEQAEFSMVHFAEEAAAIGTEADASLDDEHDDEHELEHRPSTPLPPDFTQGHQQVALMPSPFEITVPPTPPHWRHLEQAHIHPTPRPSLQAPGGEWLEAHTTHLQALYALTDPGTRAALYGPSDDEVSSYQAIMKSPRRRRDDAQIDYLRNSAPIYVPRLLWFQYWISPRRLSPGLFLYNAPHDRALRVGPAEDLAVARFVEDVCSENGGVDPFRKWVVVNRLMMALVEEERAMIVRKTMRLTVLFFVASVFALLVAAVPLRYQSPWRGPNPPPYPEPYIGPTDLDIDALGKLYPLSMSQLKALRDKYTIMRYKKLSAIANEHPNAMPSPEYYELIREDLEIQIQGKISAAVRRAIKKQGRPPALTELEQMIFDLEDQLNTVLVCEFQAQLVADDCAQEARLLRKRLEELERRRDAQQRKENANADAGKHGWTTEPPAPGSMATGGETRAAATQHPSVGEPAPEKQGERPPAGPADHHPPDLPPSRMSSVKIPSPASVLGRLPLARRIGHSLSQGARGLAHQMTALMRSHPRPAPVRDRIKPGTATPAKALMPHVFGETS